LNENLFREFRILNTNIIKNRSFFLIENSTKKENFLLSQVLSYGRTGNFDICSELYPFKDFQELQKHKDQKQLKKSKKANKDLLDFTNDKTQRIYDRLFFDFDFDKIPEISYLKDSINHAILTNNKQVKKELISKYHEHLLNNKTALKPLEELRKLTKFLDDKNIKSYPIFSGSKGFHLYIFFKPTLFDKDSFNVIAYDIFKHFRDTLKLQLLDENVFKNPSERIIRLPYFKHPVTELYTYPININDSYTEIIKGSFNPKINNFNIANYVNATGNLELLELIKSREITTKEQIKELKVKDNKIRNIQKQRLLKKVENNKDFKIVEKDCRKIANKFLGSPKYDNGKYLLYNCCFHHDTHPSLTVYEDRFVCHCIGELNYLGFVMKYFNCDKNEGMRILLNEF
jgi:hypothetical protein